MPGVTWTEGTPQQPVSGYALFGMPIPLDNATVWGDATATHTEATAAGSSWTAGVPEGGAAVHLLFGGIILNQLVFSENAVTLTEITVPSTTYSEVTI